jgi:hypothetical protein
MQIADNYKFSNVEIKNDVIDAMFRQTKDGSTKPLRIFRLRENLATDYDLGRIGSAYLDKDFINLWVSDASKDLNGIREIS